MIDVKRNVDLHTYKLGGVVVKTLIELFETIKFEMFLLTVDKLQNT